MFFLPSPHALDSFNLIYYFMCDQKQNLLTATIISNIGTQIKACKQGWTGQMPFEKGVFHE